MSPFVEVNAPCRVYWGSHGCMLPRGHDPESQHVCVCGELPYYGDATNFYGEDAPDGI